MPVRMKDVARDLNVSVVTVSKALRDQSDISTATKRRVLKRARELNYQPNWIARSLVSGRTHTIGLVVPDLMYSFFAEVAKGLSEKVRTFGYQVVISISEEDPKLEREEVGLLLARRVDGLVLASAQPMTSPELFRTIEERNVPYVLIDRKILGHKANYVGVDDEKVGRLATEHLIACGCHGPIAGRKATAGRRILFQRPGGFRRPSSDLGRRAESPARHCSGRGWQCSLLGPTASSAQYGRPEQRPGGAKCCGTPVASH
jgi:LacI family transcriptional regulator